MTFTVNRKQLLDALGACKCAVEKRSTIPILAAVKIHVGTDVCTVIATDLETAVQRSIPVTNVSAFIGPMDVVIGHELMTKFLTANKDAVNAIFDVVEGPGPVKCDRCEGSGEHDKPHMSPPVKMTCELCKGKGEYQPAVSGKVSITAGASITVDTFSPEAYPELPDIGGADWPVTNILHIGLPTWFDMTGKVVYAISKEESRFTLNGFLLEVSDKVRVVATDGHRLAVVERGEMPEGTETQAVIIPKSLSANIAKIWGAKSKEAITIMVTKRLPTEKDKDPANYIVVIGGDTILVSRKLTGNFPDYKRVLPGYEVEPARITAADFIRGINGVKACADDRSHAIKLSFNATAVNVFAETHEKGKASVDVPCQTGAAHGVVVGLNADYLLQYLSTLDKIDVVTVWCNGAAVEVPADPLHHGPAEEDPAEAKRRKNAASCAWEFRSAGDCGLRSVIMPMRVQ